MPFEPGNKLGGQKPKKSNKVAGMAREQTEAAINRLIQALGNPDDNVAIKAANSLLDRGWGKPQEYVEHSGDEENPISHNLIVKFVVPNPNT